MRIAVGQYYAHEYTTKDRGIEKHIIKVIPNSPHISGSIVRTQTLRISNEEVQELYLTDWVSDSIQREATVEEIKLFRKTRDQLNDLLTIKFGGQYMKQGYCFIAKNPVADMHTKGAIRQGDKIIVLKIKKSPNNISQDRLIESAEESYVIRNERTGHILSLSFKQLKALEW
ncbi:hypothetical protein ABE325_21475 [Bacillus licheniformis]